MKYAVLDTDFISKLHGTTNIKGQPFIDKIFLLKNYSFYCHSQIKTELEKNLNPYPTKWLLSHILDKTIQCLSDGDILELLKTNYHTDNIPGLFYQYLNQLKTACNIFDSTFYQKNYSQLEGQTPTSLDDAEKLIKTCDSAIKNGNHLGEIKDATLTLCLNSLCKGNVYEFCSDDQDARLSILANNGFENCSISCISAIGFFFICKLKKFTDEKEAREYFTSWLRYHEKTKQRKFPVKHYFSDRKQTIEYDKIEGWEIFENILDGTIVMDADGFLRKK